MGFEWAYRSGPPAWDIGRPQPALVRVADAGVLGGSVIDVGCGTGDNALLLASRGLDVTGIDASPTAIERAREKAAVAGLPAEFLVHDALDLEGLGRTFDGAIDSGLFHVFPDTDRGRFALALHAVLRPGARYVLLCFSDREPGTMGPRRVSQAEIRSTFASGWAVDSIMEERFDTADPQRGELQRHAWLATLTRR